MHAGVAWRKAMVLFFVFLLLWFVFGSVFPSRGVCLGSCRNVVGVGLGVGTGVGVGVGRFAGLARRDGAWCSVAWRVERKGCSSKTPLVEYDEAVPGSPGASQLAGSD